MEVIFAQILHMHIQIITENIFCCLNAIKGCDSMGPILFIRDIINLQPEHLCRFLEGLYKVKELEYVSGIFGCFGF